MLLRKLWIAILSISSFGIIQGSLPENDSYSLILFTLERNVVHVEHFAVGELQQEVTRLSRKDCKRHCLYVLHLGERGQHVSSIEFDCDNLRNCRVKSYHGKKPTTYILDWPKLILQEDIEAVPEMLAEVAIREVFNDTAQTKDPHERWYTSLSVAWQGKQAQSLTRTLIIERKIQSACAIVVANDAIEEIEDMAIDMKKQELLAAGILWPMQKEQKENSIKIPSRESSISGATSEQGVQPSPAEQVSISPAQKEAWYVTWYQTVLAKIYALKAYLFGTSKAC